MSHTAICGHLKPLNQRTISLSAGSEVLSRAVRAPRYNRLAQENIGERIKGMAVKCISSNYVSLFYDLRHNFKQ